MLSLRDLQHAFSAAILAEPRDAICEAIFDDGFPAAERVRIYRNNFRSNLTQTLRMTYPAVDRLVGGAFFDWAAEAFMRAHPPDSGDLNEYGARFPAFLAAFPPAAALPYLADVARFEWALNVAANAADATTLDAGAVAKVDPQHHTSLRFEPHPSLSLLAVSYPADHIADAVLSGDDAAIAQIDMASGPVHLVIHRATNGVEAQRVDSDAYRFLSRLYAGESLGTLLDDAPQEAPALLAEQLTKGRLKASRIDRASVHETTNDLQ